MTELYFVKELFRLYLVYEYLTSNQEFISQQRKGVALPLLNTIHTMRNHFHNHPTIIKLDPYIELLESIVGSEDAKTLKAIIYGDSADVKDYYIKDIIRLQQTREVEDFVCEIRNALVVAEKLVDRGFRYQDIDAFLLAMVLKEDYSWSLLERQNKVNINYVEMALPKQDENLIDHFRNYTEYIRNGLNLGQHDTYLCLAECDRRVFNLSLTGSQFSKVAQSDYWDAGTMQEWLDLDFSDLTFDLTVRRHGQIEQYLEDDQLADLARIKETLRFTAVPLPPSHSISIVKDIALSSFPHNLIMGDDGEFISRKCPIACLPSTEWYIQALQKGSRINANFTSGIWIPTEGGDLTLNLLWSNLDPVVSELGIKAFHTQLPEQPLNHEINIICAHGASNIASFEAVATNDTQFVLDLDFIAGPGTICLLFVCHSGAMKTGLFRNQVLTLVRKFISAGYQAVIAPFWSLHISIPPIWLPEFFTSIRNQLTISEAVYKANCKVYESNKNPGAWACLHLYGNPYLKTDIE